MKTCKDLITLLALVRYSSIVCYEFPAHFVDGQRSTMSGTATTYTFHGACLDSQRANDEQTLELTLGFSVFDSFEEYADEFRRCHPSPSAEYDPRRFLCLGCTQQLHHPRL